MTTPYASLIADVRKKATDLQKAKADLLSAEAIALLRAKLDPIADILDAREQFAPMVQGTGANPVIPLAGTDQELQALAENYRLGRKADVMFGNPPGTALRRELERGLNVAYGLPEGTQAAG
jgi:hypothetical protein